MILLLDENISYRLKKKLANDFNVFHVTDFFSSATSDLKIWEFARSSNHTILTFDEDFYELSHLKGFPPKVIWIRTGNISSQRLSEILLDNKSNIFSFLDNEDVGCIEIYTE